MKKIILIIAMLCAIDTLFAQITIDGDASEWAGTSPVTENTGIYSYKTAGTPSGINEWIWKDAAFDNRTDPWGGDGSKQDIHEVRFASTSSNFYYLVKFPTNIDKTPGDGSLQIQITIRRNFSTSTAEWLGGFADTKVSASSPDSRWDYLIITRAGSSNTNNQVFTNTWSVFYVGSLAWNTANGIYEGSVPWSSLGGTPGNEPIVVTVSLFRANSSDNTFDTGGDNSKGNCLDYITTTSGNTYGALIGISEGGTNNLGRLDYGQSIQFLSDEVLPIQLASFVGSYIENGAAKLVWETVSEVNNYGFNVQRLNGENFETIGFVAGKGEPSTYEYIDAQAGNTYRLEQMDNDGLTTLYGPIYLNPNSVPNESVPAVFALNQNYPNPFNPTTTISFSLANAGYTTLKVYNLIGKEVATLFNGNAEAGKSYIVDFDAKNLTSGMYFYKLQSGSNVEVKKLTLVK